MMNISRALVLAAHTDDGEFGCGGTLARLVDQGALVTYVAFSICEASVPEGFPRDILATEVEEATQVLGIDPDHLLVYHYPVRYLPQHRQDILEELVRIGRELRPDLVLLPSTDDLHQDHQVVCQEGVRAFKHTSILGYEMPWNNISFDTLAFSKLDEAHIRKKINALLCYESQKHRDYLNAEFIRSLATTRGVQIHTRFAEAFEVVRWIVE